MWKWCVQLRALHRKCRNRQKAAKLPSGYLCFFICLSFFPCWNEIYYHVWISHPEGLFMRLLKLLTSKSSCKLGFWKSQASLYHRQICWQPAYTSIMQKMGVFNLRGNTLLKVLFSLKSTYNVYQISCTKNSLNWGFRDHFPASLWL